MATEAKWTPYDAEIANLAAMDMAGVAGPLIELRLRREGFLRCEAERVAPLMEVLERIVKIPCLTALLGESYDEDGCGCARCLAEVALAAAKLKGDAS